MLATALLALIPLVPVQSDDPAPAPPTPEEIKTACDTLKKAFAGKEMQPKLEAVEAARDVLDKKVVTAIAKGMKEDEDEVKTATLDALRWMDHPQALKELHSIYKRDKKLPDNEELFPALLKAIGQHANPESIAVLTDNPFKSRNAASVEARILGLGRIRDEASVGELIGMMQLVGKGKTAGKMDDFRLALMALTGVDKGKSREAWIGWWNDNKKKLELPKEMPRLSEKMQRRWDYYWGEPHERSRSTRREDRGGDE